MRLVVCLVGLAGVAGCCGGGPSHKCDFTPPNGGMDAGSDAPFPCGTTVCDPSQVCCFKKAPAGAACIPPTDFIADGCEKLDLPCVAPADCPNGVVCCVVLNPGAVTCLPAQVCPGDGVNTYRACTVDTDCPNRVIGSCQPIGSVDDGGTLNICLQ